MNAISTFNFAPGLNLRTITKGGGEPWFVAADVCRSLDMDIRTGTQRWTMGLDAAEKGTVQRTESEFRMLFAAHAHSVAIINESGLYALVMRSRKPEAQKFRKWVTSEVLPAIRKTGSYIEPQRCVAVAALAELMAT